MKYYIIAIVAAACLLMARCGVKRELRSDLATAMTRLPSKISAEDQAKLEEAYYRGYHLYKETCSGCHGVGGKDTIPHFTFSQLDNYNDSVKRGDPENHAVMKKLSPEQVSDVLSFLFYRTLARQAVHKEVK